MPFLARMLDSAAFPSTRRSLLRHLGCAAVVSLAGCAAARARAPVRVGLLFPDAAESYAAQMQRFQQRLTTLGFAQGKDVVLDARYAPAGADLETQAQSLASSGAAVLIGVTLGPTAALMRATPAGVPPILFVAIGDPVARGLVASLDAPGGRITGSSDLIPDIGRQRLALLAQVLPRAKTVAVISNAAITPRAPLDAAAASHGLRLVHVDVRVAPDFPRAYEAMAREQVDALLVTPNGVTYAERHRLAEWARSRRLPAIFGWREFMDAGGLLSLGADTGRLYEVAAEQLVAIVQGASPAHLAVAAPRAELVLDLRTARELSISVPAGVLSQANHVIG